MGAGLQGRAEELLETLVDAGSQVVCMDDLSGVAYSLEIEPIGVVVLDDGLLPAGSWPGVLTGAPTVVVTCRPGAYPHAAREVDMRDAAGLLDVLDGLLPDSGG